MHASMEKEWYHFIYATEHDQRDLPVFVAANEKISHAIFNPTSLHFPISP